jgi:hypothetical protein
MSPLSLFCFSLFSADTSKQKKALWPKMNSIVLHALFQAFIRLKYGEESSHVSISFLCMLRSFLGISFSQKCARWVHIYATPNNSNTFSFSPLTAPASSTMAQNISGKLHVLLRAFLLLKYTPTTSHAQNQRSHSYMFWPAFALAQMTSKKVHVSCHLNKSIIPTCPNHDCPEA